MSSYLAIHIRLHDGRYHGAGDWPPSPARVYQALVAGVGLSGPIPEAVGEALRWLESLSAPEIIVPQYRTGTGFTTYVPNNDLDAMKGDPKQIGGIRAGKTIRVRLFDETCPMRYIWQFRNDEKSQAYARNIVETAERLYQFGRGVDFAWAVGEILNEGRLAELRELEGFTQFSPDSGSRGLTLASPMSGSFQSLKDRYQAGARRFKFTRRGKGVSQTFSQPPQARFHLTSYNSPSTILLFDLRHESEESYRYSAPLESATAITVSVRDAALERLRTGLSEKSTEIDRCLLGKNPDGSHRGTAKERITVLPIPSIGHQHADLLIRRVAILISPNSPISVSDTRWAFSNLRIRQLETEIALLPSAETSMLDHYGHNGSAQTWCTITPVVLSEAAARRRISPRKKREQAKNAEEKANEEQRAAAAVTQALRHSGYSEADAIVTKLQRVPFQAHGKRVEEFSLGSRFPKERLWHVTIQFSKFMRGPLLIGDGRFCGLGLFAPLSEKES